LSTLVAFESLRSEIEQRIYNLELMSSQNLVSDYDFVLQKMPGKLTRLIAKTQPRIAELR